MSFEPTPLNILLLGLIVAAIWAVVELALTIRKARTTLGEVAQSANDTIGQVQPIIGKVDGAMDELQPSLKEVQPLLERVGTTLDSANASLGHVNGILGDVSHVSDGVASVTGTVKNVAGTAVTGVATVVNKIAGRSNPEPAPAQLSAAEQFGLDQDAAPADSGYVSYVTIPAEAPAGPAAEESAE